MIFVIESSNVNAILTEAAPARAIGTDNEVVIVRPVRSADRPNFRSLYWADASPFVNFDDVNPRITFSRARVAI